MHNKRAELYGDGGREAEKKRERERRHVLTLVSVALIFLRLFLVGSQVEQSQLVLASAGGEKCDTTAVLICGRDRRPSHGGEPGVRVTGQRKAENTTALNNPPVTWGP